MTDLQGAVQPLVVCCDALQLLALPIRLQPHQHRRRRSARRAHVTRLHALGLRWQALGVRVLRRLDDLRDAPEDVVVVAFDPCVPASAN